MTSPPLALIEVSNVWQLTGEVVWRGIFDAHQLLPSLAEADGDCALVLSWGADQSYLSVEIQAEAPGTDLDDVEELRRLLVNYGIPRNLVASEQGWGPGQRFAVCTAVRPRSSLTLSVRVNTDDGRFLALADALPKDHEEGLSVPLSLRGFARSTATPKQHRLTLCLQPARPLPVYPGSVAIDLGSTTSCVASMRLSDEVSDIKVRNVEGEAGMAPVPSVVRLLDHKPGAEERAIEPAAWDFGWRAVYRPDGWLVLGAKRLLADPKAGERLRAWLGDRSVAVSKQLPAELLVSSLLKGFCRQVAAAPSRLALTCPITFSGREILALKRVVYRAWMRARHQSNWDHDRHDLNELIPLVLDEASAAAFYFLYRDHVQAPGGLRGFRYLYPRGLNLLLYDCGGATTDTALVHAIAPTLDSLSITVRGRTGLRNFGGDNVTAAVFRLLKAKTAVALADARGDVQKLVLPRTVSELEGWLKAQAAAIDTLVPTFFRLDLIAQAPQRQRRDAALELWYLAERLKFQLSERDAGAEPCSVSFSDRETIRLVPFLAEHNRINPSECLSRLAAVRLSRAEVDTLVRAPLRKSIESANRMLAARLEPDEQVHAVYVVGNGWRYPLVGEVLRHHLQVRFLNEHPMVSANKLCVDKEDLKNAVAKGAVLALTLLQRLQGIRLDFDSRLSERLPFDILYRDSAAGSYRPLFRENTLYNELGQMTIAVPHTEVQEKGSTVVFLSRSWPGEETPQPYLCFRFEEPVRGELLVRYADNEESPGFQMIDTGRNGLIVQGEEVADTVYDSPIQSGQL